MGKFIDELKETRRNQFDEEERKFDKVERASFAELKEKHPIKPGKFILTMALYLLTLFFIAISLMSLVDISTMALASQISDTNKSNGKGYTYGRVVPNSVTIDYRSFQSLARLNYYVVLEYSDSFFHSQPDEEFTPFITTNEDYSEQLTPHIVMPYRYLTDNYFNFSLLSGEPIEQIWTPGIYITQGFADDLLEVDADLRVSFAQKGYDALLDYELEGNIYYYGEEARVFTVGGVIDSSSLGRFSNINGGSFIYCSFDATYWCFGKPALEFFLYGDDVSLASYFTYLQKGMAYYGMDLFETEIYDWVNGELALGALNTQYQATKAFYESKTRFVVGGIFAVLALSCFAIFNILINKMMEEDYVMIAIGKYMPLPVFLVTALVIALLLLMPNIIINNIIFNLGNYMSVTFVLLLSLFISCTISFFTVEVYKDEMSKIKRGAKPPLSLVEGAK